jgi:hypothetical protein
LKPKDSTLSIGINKKAAGFLTTGFLSSQFPNIIFGYCVISVPKASSAQGPALHSIQ